MSLETRLITLVQAIGTDIKTAFQRLGNLTNLTTTNKDSLVDAVNELKASNSTSDATAGVVAGADNTLNVENTADTTAVFYAHRSQLNIFSSAKIKSGGWGSAYGGMAIVGGDFDIDKVVVNFSQTHITGTGLVNGVLGYEAVLSGVASDANLQAWAGFWVPNMRNVSNIDNVPVLAAYVNEDPMAVSWTLAPYYAPTKQEFSTAYHIGYIPGRLYSAEYANLTEEAVTPHIYYLVPVHIAHRTDITALGIRVTTAGVSGARCRLGIYTCVNGKVGSLKYGSSEIAVDTTGVKEISVSNVTLDTGVYWLALSAGATFGTNWHIQLGQNRTAMIGQEVDNASVGNMKVSAIIWSTYGIMPTVADVVPTFTNADGEPHIWFKATSSTGFGAMGGGGAVDTGGGETNTASNVGDSGQGVYAQKIGTDLQFKKLNVGTYLTINATSDKITFDMDSVAVQTLITTEVNNRTPKITVGTTAPSTPSIGEIWVDTN